VPSDEAGTFASGSERVETGTGKDSQRFYRPLRGGRYSFPGPSIACSRHFVGAKLGNDTSVSLELRSRGDRTF
jgi:hypothetical protein